MEIEILVFPLGKKNEEEQDPNIFAKTAGILSSRNVDPIKWQNDIRKEWER